MQGARVGARYVDQDAVEPGAQRRARLEAIKELQRGQPGVLHHLGRRRRIVRPGALDAQKARLVSGHQAGERRLIAAVQGGDGGGVVGAVVPLHLPRLPTLTER